EQVGRISRAAQRGATLTRQLLAFSRHGEADAAPLDIDALLGDMGFLLERLLGAQVTVKVDAGSGCRIVADAGEIQQVLMNLAINARDAMPDGGRLEMISSRVEVAPEAAAGDAGLPPGRYALLAVSDTGTGMDAQTRARIFEPFFTTKPADQGSGLGLSTVYGIVQRLGGHLQVETAPGKGTTFRLYFPCKP
ncbi:MAG: sensor histidine kinase, partial [Pseudomonadales bacterium]